jgi:hypothetical protein
MQKLCPVPWLNVCHFDPFSSLSLIFGLAPKSNSENQPLIADLQQLPNVASPMKASVISPPASAQKRTSRDEDEEQQQQQQLQSPSGDPPPAVSRISLKDYRKKRKIMDAEAESATSPMDENPNTITSPVDHVENEQQ